MDGNDLFPGTALELSAWTVLEGVYRIEPLPCPDDDLLTVAAYLTEGYGTITDTGARTYLGRVWVYEDAARLIARDSYPAVVAEVEDYVLVHDGRDGNLIEDARQAERDRKTAAESLAGKVWVD